MNKNQPSEAQANTITLTQDEVTQTVLAAMEFGRSHKPMNCTEYFELEDFMLFIMTTVRHFKPKVSSTTPPR